MAVIHRAAEQRFVLELPEGVAVLEYQLVGAGVMDIQSTVVPTAARGRGTGGQLVEAALEYARVEGLRVIPSCWFVATWVADHPAYRPLLGS